MYNDALNYWRSYSTIGLFADDSKLYRAIVLPPKSDWKLSYEQYSERDNPKGHIFILRTNQQIEMLEWSKSPYLFIHVIQRMPPFQKGTKNIVWPSNLPVNKTANDLGKTREKLNCNLDHWKDKWERVASNSWETQGLARRNRRYEEIGRW